LRNYPAPRTPKKYYTINHNISVSPLRVVDHESKQIGLLSKEEAMKMAMEREADLVLIAPNAKPPVAKMIDFKKFLYQEGKKLKDSRKGIKKSTVKDIKISLFIAEGDLKRFEEKAKEFLSDGNQVRINLSLKGREMGKKDMAVRKAKEFIARLGDVNVSKEPKVEGRVIRAVVSRKK